MLAQFGLPASGLIYAALGVSAAIFTFLVIPLLMPLMRRYALARPNARSSHVTPTPQGGGIPIVIALATGCALAAIVGIVPEADRLTAFTLALAALVLAALGLVDDIKTLPVLPRLGTQFAICLALMVVTPPDVMLFHGLMPLILERALIVFALVWMINLTNFMDGLDWITIAQFVPMSVGLVMATLLGFAAPITGVSAALLGGGLIGFAPYNRPVAKLFLGDVGSLPIGLVAGYALYRYGAATDLFAALIIALYPLADATITLIKRLRRGEKIWEAHRSHFYQQATKNGYQVIEVVSHIALAMAVFAALSVSIAMTPDITTHILLTVVAIFGVVGLLRRFAGPT